MPSSTDRAPTKSILLLVLHGMLAFFLNVANFNAVKQGGPLMMNVIGNVKQVTMVILSVFFFKNKMKPIGIIGSVICIAGSMWYSYGWNSPRSSLIENQRERMSKAEKVSDGESETLLKKDRV